MCAPSLQTRARDFAVRVEPILDRADQLRGEVVMSTVNQVNEPSGPTEAMNPCGIGSAHSSLNPRAKKLSLAILQTFSHHCEDMSEAYG